MSRSLSSPGGYNGWWRIPRRTACACAALILAWWTAPLLAQDVEAESDDVLMAIFAHPDDEGLVGPILHKYAREGASVILVTATDGRLGTNEFSGLPAGDELAAVRREELKCAASTLGIELIHLDYEDQFRAAEGYDGFTPQLQGLIRDLRDIIRERNPDAIITFGPDGVTNHMDHRLVGSSVTQVIVSQEWDRTPDLYYFGLPAASVPEDERVLRGVQEKYLTTQIPYSDEDRRTAIEAMRCHASQFRPDEVEQTMNELGGREKIVYLRPFVAPTGRSDKLFD